MGREKKNVPSGEKVEEIVEAARVERLQSARVVDGKVSVHAEKRSVSRH